MYRINDTLCENFEYCRILASGSPQIVRREQATHYLVNGELYDINSTVEDVEQQTTYTAEQLAEMTTAELKAICTELGISGSMTKANMIALILDKQNSIA